MNIATLAEKYLAWCEKHRSPRTVVWYRGHLDGFLAHLGSPLLVTELKPYHVVEWVDAHPAWGDTYKRGAIMAVQRACNWAGELGYIEDSPIKRIKKPAARRRDNPMSPDDFQAVLGFLAEGDPFRELLVFVWNTGVRPQEARHIEARHVQFDRERIVIPAEEAKGKRYPRIIYLHA